MRETSDLPPPIPPDDTEMLQRLLKRESGAWFFLQSQLLDWLYTFLRSRLYWMTDDQIRECVEETTQAASERILRRLYLYRGEGSLLGWCRVVALNVCNDWIRRDRRARLAAPAPLHEASAYSDDPITQFERTAELEKIQASIDVYVSTKLTEREQIILEQTDIPTDQVAARLGITANNLYQIRHRALGRIRRHLENQGYNRQRLAEWDIL